MNQKRKSIIQGNAISEVVTLSLGRTNQKVLIEGKNVESPVVITLHGGPGMPVPFGVGCRGLFPDFTEQFVMVYWDQLGCGINNAIIDDTFHIENFVEMTVDLVNEMKRRFPDNKILLFGVSWGSVLCLQTADRLKKQIDGAIVWGQIVKKPIYNQTVYEELIKKKLSKSDKAELDRLWNQPVTNKTIQFIAKCIRKYTEGYVNKSGKRAPMGAMLYGLLTGPDYKIKDVKAIVMNGSAKNQSIWQELSRIDMSQMLEQMQIPYRILQGDTDIVTDTQTVVNLISNAANKNLNCRIIENSGHIPGTEGMSAALEELEKLKEMI